MSQTKAQLISDLVQALNFTGTSSAPANGAFLSAPNTLALATNSGQRLTIDSTGKVGIGKTSPSQKLQVGGDGGDACLSLIRTNAASNDNAYGHIFFENSSDATLASISARRESATDDSYLTFSTQSTGNSIAERIRITSGGKVGIGTTNPSFRLQIQGTDNASSGLYLYNGTGGEGIKIVPESNGNCRIYSSTADVLTLGTNSTDRITIAGDGSYTTFSGGDFGFGAFPGGTPAGKNVFIAIGDSDTGIVQDGDGQLELWANATEVANINAIDGYTSTKRIYTTGDGRFAQVRINSTTENTDSAFNDLIIGDYSNNRGISILSSGTGQGAVGFAKSGATADGYIAYQHNGTATSSAMTLKSQGHIKFNAGSSTKLYIEHDGKVGIGTTSPNSRLNLKLSSRGSADFRITDSDTTNDVLRAGSQADGDGFFQLRTVAGAGNVLFDASGVSYFTGGNVGIGTTSPSSHLHIKNTSGAAILNLEASANGGEALFKAIGKSGGGDSRTIQFRYDSGGDAGRIITAENIPIQIMTQNSTRIHVAGDGKVGMGTTSPSEQFHLLKSHNGHTRAIIQNNWGASATAQLKLISPTDEFQLVKYASGAAALNLSNNSRIYHSVGGQVRHQITADSAGQTACVINTPADGGVNSQYVTATKAASGNYNTFRVTINQSSWGSFFLKVYVSAHDGNSAYKWVTGYMNTGFSTVLNTLSNMSGNFSGGTAQQTHISGQTWKYEIITNGGNSSVTHPVMGVEVIFGGNGNMLDTGSISLEIS